jgi:hypothetical protein
MNVRVGAVAANGKVGILMAEEYLRYLLDAAQEADGRWRGSVVRQDSHFIAYMSGGGAFKISTIQTFATQEEAIGAAKGLADAAE